MKREIAEGIRGRVRIISRCGKDEGPCQTCQREVVAINQALDVLVSDEAEDLLAQLVAQWKTDPKSGSRFPRAVYDRAIALVEQRQKEQG